MLPSLAAFVRTASNAPLRKNIRVTLVQRGPPLWRTPSLFSKAMKMSGNGARLFSTETTTTAESKTQVPPAQAQETTPPSEGADPAVDASKTSDAADTDLQLLRNLATGAPNNPTVQYIFLKELNKTNPQQVIEYYREGKIAAGEEATKEYIKALAKQGKIEEVDLASLSSFYKSSKAETDDKPRSVATPLLNVGTMTKPLIVKTVTGPLGTFISVLWLLVGGTLLFLWYKNSGGSDISSVLSNKVNEVIPSDVKTKFSDVIGNSEAKEELSTIVEFLRSPATYTRFQAQLPRVSS